MKKTIAILSGDGVGPEIMPHAVCVLKNIAQKFNFDYEFIEADIGGVAYDQYGEHFPTPTKQICEQADAVLFGSVGGPVQEASQTKWQDCEKNSILALRKTLNLQVNIRPVQIYQELMGQSPLKAERLQAVDFLIVRELAGDIYFGEHKKFTRNNIAYATDVAQYNEHQISFAAHCAFKLAQKRKHKVTSVDKANVLATSQLWRQVVNTVAGGYPDVELEHMLVDNCALQLFLNPAQFDVVVTSNLFGDILSDAAAGIAGSIGLIPSASLSAEQKGLYEPAGGSAPDIAGKNKANPIAQFLSAAMLLRLSFGQEEAAQRIELAIASTLADGFFTPDIAVAKWVGTREFSDEVVKRI